MGKSTMTKNDINDKTVSKLFSIGGIIVFLVFISTFLIDWVLFDQINFKNIGIGVLGFIIALLFAAPLMKN